MPDETQEDFPNWLEQEPEEAEQAMVVVHKNERSVYEALRNRFPPDAWAMFPSVRNTTGHARAIRTADAIALGLWPSRGLYLYGFEIKVSRQDMLKELADPKKAEPVARYCDQWWIAIGDKKIVQPDELPDAWGLLVPHGKTMKIAKKAHKLDPEPMDRAFIAAILRRAQEECSEDVLRRRVWGRAVEEAKEMLRNNAEWELREATEERDALRKTVMELKQNIQEITGTRAGISPEQLVAAHRLLHRIRSWNGLRGQLLFSRNSLSRIAEAIPGQLEVLSGLIELADQVKDGKATI